MRKTLLGLCVLSALAGPANATETQTEAQRIAALEAKVQALEAELQQLKAAPPGTTAQQPVAPAPAVAGDTTQSELDALAATPEESATNDTAAVAAPTADSGGSNANAFNPAISIILNGS
jgi:type II secretory pathway component PulJ